MTTPLIPPTSFVPFVNALSQSLVGALSGALPQQYPISFGQYNIDKAWDGQTVAVQAVAAEGTNNIIVDVGTPVNKNRWQETYSTSIYDVPVDIKVQMAFTGSAADGTARMLAQAQLFDLSTKIRATLCSGPNLLTDVNGNFTGLSSGMLQFTQGTAPVWIWENTAYGSITLTFLAYLNITKQ